MQKKAAVRLTAVGAAVALVGVGLSLRPIGGVAVASAVPLTPVRPPMVVSAAAGPAAVPTPVVERAAVASERRVIGRSVEGRKIKAFRYGPANAAKTVVIIGQMHGNETGGLPIARRLRTLGAPGATSMWVIPTLSPDALAKKQRKNAHGVDINRNSPDLWKGTARSPEYYPGPSAMSEPETRSYVAFLNEVNPALVLIYHQAGNGVDSYKAKNMGLVNGLGQRMRLPVQSFDCDGECTGTLTGWFNSTHRGVALTVELPARVTTQAVKRWTQAAIWAIGYI